VDNQFIGLHVPSDQMITSDKMIRLYHQMRSLEVCLTSVCIRSLGSIPACMLMAGGNPLVSGLSQPLIRAIHSKRFSTFQSFNLSLYYVHYCTKLRWTYTCISLVNVLYESVHSYRRQRPFDNLCSAYYRKFLPLDSFDTNH
jgi:hypothetical protein